MAPRRGNPRGLTTAAATLRQVTPRRMAGPRSVLRAGVAELVEAVECDALPLEQAALVALFAPDDQRVILRATAGMVSRDRAALLRLLVGREVAR